jgi:glycine oxidase
MFFLLTFVIGVVVEEVQVERAFDVIIVGNGILAYSTAFALMQEDASLTIGIVGPEARTWGATGASGAMLGCFGEVTHTSLKSQAGKAKFDMALQAKALWENWLTAINHYLEPSQQSRIWPGTYVILNAKSGEIEDENYRAIADNLAEYKQDYHEIAHPCVIPGLEPAQDCRPLRALYLSDEGSIDSTQLLTNLQYIVSQRYGVKIIDGLVSRVKTSQGMHSVQLEDGQWFSGKQILLAAGAKSQDMLDQLPELARRIPPLFAGVGFSVIAKKPKHDIRAVIRTPNRSFSCGLHIVPRDKDCLYIGATNNAHLRPVTHPNMGDVHFLLECAIEQVHQGFEKVEISKFNVGNRPLTIDTYPLIGQTSIEGLWLLTGTYREGFHLSPLLGQHIARQMLGKPPLFENDLFLPERLPISTMTKQEAITEAVKHYMALTFEFSMRMPQTGWQRKSQEMLHLQTAKLYDDLETDKFVLPPNFITLIESDPQRMLPVFRDYYKSLS